MQNKPTIGKKYILPKGKIFSSYSFNGEKQSGTTKKDIIVKIVDPGIKSSEVFCEEFGNILVWTSDLKCLRR